MKQQWVKLLPLTVWRSRRQMDQPSGWKETLQRKDTTISQTVLMGKFFTSLEISSTCKDKAKDGVVWRFLTYSCQMKVIICARKAVHKTPVPTWRWQFQVQITIHSCYHLRSTVFRSASASVPMHQISWVSEWLSYAIFLHKLGQQHRNIYINIECLLPKVAPKPVYRDGELSLIT